MNILAVCGLKKMLSTTTVVHANQQFMSAGESGVRGIKVGHAGEAVGQGSRQGSVEKPNRGAGCARLGSTQKGCQRGQALTVPAIFQK